MREIKFRAWDKENRRWMTPEIEDNEESELRLDIWGNIYFRKPWFEQESGASVIVSGEDVFDLSQHTGLKDKNGVEIYEGDIVKWSRLCIDFNLENYEERSDNFIVEWDVYNTGFVLSEGEMYLYKDISAELEVIGNKFEHPELLEEI